MSGFKTQPPVMMCGMNVAGINEVDQRGRWHLSYNPSVQGYGCVTTLADIAGPALFTKLFNAFKAGAKHESD